MHCIMLCTVSIAQNVTNSSKPGRCVGSRCKELPTIRFTSSRISSQSFRSSKISNVLSMSSMLQNAIEL